MLLRILIAILSAVTFCSCGFEEEVLGLCADADGDGWSDIACGGKDCVDSNPRIYPGAVEACNAVDDDCDEEIDEWTMTTVAGKQPGGYQDGTRDQALFNKPIGLSWASTRILYVTEHQNDTIRAVHLDLDPADPNYVTTVAGIHGTPDPLADGSKQQATFNHAYDLEWVPGGPRGVLYISDRDHNAVRKVDLNSNDPANDPNYVTTIATVQRPTGLAVDEQGNIYAAESAAGCIRKIDANNTVTSFTGQCGSPGFADGPPASARFRNPSGLAFDVEGNLLVADNENHRIRKVDPQGHVTTIAGTGTPGWADGRALESAKLWSPSDVAYDPSSGNIYICDLQNQRIRVLDPTGWLLTIIGTGTEGYSGDGPACGSEIADPFGVEVDSQGNFYISDANNYMIRMVTP